MKDFAPICGQSDLRNQQYLENYSPQKFFDALVSSQSPIIFDVGAHRGESVRFFKEIYPSATIYSFEPDFENFKVLQDVCQEFNLVNCGAGKCLTINAAVAEKDGEVRFFRQGISHLGGLLPINKRSKDSLGYAETAENMPVLVSAVCLDSFCANNAIDKIDILKIDVQGYEIGVLEGAKNVLKNTQCCSVEISLYDFYDRSSNLKDVEQMMQNAGLALWDIPKISKNPKTLRTDWLELVYVRNINTVE